MTKVLVNGTFDIIHPGHVELLNYAKSLGDYLVVFIDTDRRVSEIKGPDRPINNQSDRKLLLQNLKAVDDVFMFDSVEEFETLEFCDAHPEKHIEQVITEINIPISFFI